MEGDGGALSSATRSLQAQSPASVPPSAADTAVGGPPAVSGSPVFPPIGAASSTSALQPPSVQTVLSPAREPVDSSLPLSAVAAMMATPRKPVASGEFKAQSSTSPVNGTNVPVFDHFVVIGATNKQLDELVRGGDQRPSVCVLGPGGGSGAGRPMRADSPERVLSLVCVACVCQLQYVSLVWWWCVCVCVCVQVMYADSAPTAAIRIEASILFEYPTPCGEDQPPVDEIVADMCFPDGIGVEQIHDVASDSSFVRQVWTVRPWG